MTDQALSTQMHEAHQCWARGDSRAALAIWIELAALNGHELWAYLWPSRVSRRLHAFDNAERYSADGCLRFPNDVDMLIEFAHCAIDRQAWDVAHSRWELVRVNFPDRVEGWIALAEHEMRVGHWSDAARAWAEVGVRQPGFWVPQFHQANCLRRDGQAAAADALLIECMSQFPKERAFQREYAIVAQHQQDWSEAAKRWEAACKTFPNVSEFYINGAVALSTAWRFDEAESLLHSGIPYVPANEVFGLQCEWAWTSLHKKDTQEAIGRFEVLCAKHPTEPGAYLGANIALNMAERFHDAVSLLTTGIEKCSNTSEMERRRIEICCVHGLGDTQGIARALVYVKEYRGKYQDDPVGCVMETDILIKLERYEEAAICIGEGLKIWPIDAALLITSAGLAGRIKNNATAQGEFARLIDLHPNRQEGYIGLSGILAGEGRYAEAEQVLRQAMAVIPTNAVVFQEYAGLATKQHAWHEAVARWVDASKRFPADTGINARLQDARLAVLGDTTEGADAPNPEGQSARGIVELVSYFESLGGGDKQGCEFGLFQRVAGFEPLSLLRWGNIDPTSLLSALRQGFSGLGDASQTIVRVILSEIGPEYIVDDTKYGLTTHSWLRVSEIEPEKASMKLRRRQHFLATKLIADIKSGAKIFVYRLITRNLTDTEIFDIHDAMRAIGGDATLLYVRYSDDGHPNGTVRLVRPGLLIGYVDRFSYSREEQALGPNHVAWRLICQNALELWQAQRNENQGL